MSERIVVPAREGRAVRVAAGRNLRVVDLEGGQVVDTWAFVDGDLAEHHSAQHTRAVNSALFPPVGGHFVTNARRPILTLEEDRSPGIHDMLIAACDPPRYVPLGVTGWHASCEENLRSALRALGLEPPRYAPQPINLFMNTPARESGEIEWLPAETKPGDYVQLRAELDLVFAVSACPQDILSINLQQPTPVAIELM